MLFAPMRVVGVVLLLMAGCGESGGPGSDARDAGVDEPCTMVPALGYGGLGADFVSFREGDSAEVVQGYQGWRFIQAVLRLEGIGPARVLANIEIEVEGHRRYAQPTWIDVDVAEDGTAYSEVFFIFFNEITYEEMVGRYCDLSVEVSHRRCPGSTAVRVQLLDEDPCIHSPGGEEDAGVCIGLDAGPDAGSDAGPDGGTD